MHYTETELAKLIQDVEQQFGVAFAKAEEEQTSLSKSVVAEPLAKAEEDKKDEHKEEKPEHKEEKPEEKPASDEKPAEESKDEAPKEDDQKGEAPEHKEAAPQDHQQADEACDYDEEDLEHMHKMYMSMGKAELRAHHDSVRHALDSHGMEKCGDMSMSKSETDKEVEVKAEDVKVAGEIEMLKSEAETQKAKAETLQKTLDSVSEFLTKLVTKTNVPKGKAVTSYDAIAKSEGAVEEQAMSKSEILGVLSKKAMDPNLSKSDREAINSYYLGGASLTSISHLLK